MARNKISNFDDVLDSRDILERLEELTESKRAYAAGWNMPGYMPDNEPARFETWEEARDYIADELNRAADECSESDRETYASLYKSGAESLSAMDTPKDGFGRTLGQWHWWIEPLHGSDQFDSPEDAEEHAALSKLAEEAESSPDWEHGETLIRDSYFENYAQELAEDCCPFPSNSPEAKLLESWPYRCIDWEQAARQLRMDYTAVDFAGVTYWIRA